MDEEIKRFKIEVASLKKGHVTPAHAIPVWRQILPAPPTKQLPQKIIHDSNNNQVGSKHLQMASILNEGQQTNKIKNFLEFIQKAMEALSTHKKQF